MLHSFRLKIGLLSLCLSGLLLLGFGIFAVSVLNRVGRERIDRADRSRSREIEGSGLGLSLAREIARAHGGELILERSEAHVTTFALTLPLAT